MSKIIAIIGGPGTGKTSVINELKKRGYGTIDEAARQVIDEGLQAGKTLWEVRGNVEKFQMAIIKREIINEKNALKTNSLTFVDRGMHDTWAYFHYEEIEIDEYVDGIMKSHRYHQVFLLDMLHDYDDADYARTEDRVEAEELHRLIELAYIKYGMDVKKVPVMSVEDRVDHIIKHSE